jgi:hypothetical protein
VLTVELKKSTRKKVAVCKTKLREGKAIMYLQCSCTISPTDLKCTPIKGKTAIFYRGETT